MTQKINELFINHPAIMVFSVALLAFIVSHVLSISGAFEALNHDKRDDYIQELKAIIEKQATRIESLERRVYNEANWHVCSNCEDL